MSSVKSASINRRPNHGRRCLGGALAGFGAKNWLFLVLGAIPFVWCLCWIVCDWVRLHEHARALQRVLDTEKQYELLVDDARRERDQVKLDRDRLSAQVAMLTVGGGPRASNHSKNKLRRNRMTEQHQIPVFQLAEILDKGTVVITGASVGDLKEGQRLYVTAAGGRPQEALSSFPKPPWR